MLRDPSNPNFETALSRGLASLYELVDQVVARHALRKTKKRARRRKLDRETLPHAPVSVATNHHLLT